MDHSIGLLCDGSCLSIIIARMEEMCPVRLEFPAFRSCKIPVEVVYFVPRGLHKVSMNN